MKTHRIHWLACPFAAILLLGSASATETGWVFIQHSDPVEGWEVFTVGTRGESLNYQGKKQKLVMSCDTRGTEKVLRIRINWGETVAPPYDLYRIPVIFRIGELPSFHVFTRSMLEGRATAFYSNDALSDDPRYVDPYSLIDDLKNASVVHARIFFKGVSYLFKADMTGFAEVAKPVLDACHPPSYKSDETPL